VGLVDHLAQGRCTLEVRLSALSSKKPDRLCAVDRSTFQKPWAGVAVE